MKRRNYITAIFIFLIGMLCAQSEEVIYDQTKPNAGSNYEDRINRIDRIVGDGDTTIIINEKVLYREPQMDKVNLNGKIFSAMIIDGDTIILADIEDVSITSLRKFDSDEEYRKYLKIRRYANKVYPYAKEAIRIFRELEYAEKTLDKKAFKKESKRLQKKLKEDFEKPLIKLTKLQGKIMIKMIEKELDETFYNLVKGLKGRFTAFYWHNFGKLYSYDLKDGYNYGKYKILDAVLQDFDISYSIDSEENLKYINNKNELKPEG